jgi:hypothetical protein
MMWQVNEPTALARFVADAPILKERLRVVLRVASTFS